MRRTVKGPALELEQHHPRLCQPSITKEFDRRTHTQKDTKKDWQCPGRTVTPLAAGTCASGNVLGRYTVRYCTVRNVMALLVLVPYCA